MITLTSGQKIMVLEPAAEVVARVIAFRRSVFSGILNCPFAQPDQREPEREPV